MELEQTYIYIPDEIMFKIIKNTSKNVIHRWRQISKKCKGMVDSYSLRYPYKLYKKKKYYCNNICDYLNIKEPYYFLVILYYTYSTCYHGSMYSYAKQNNHNGLLKLLEHIYNGKNLEEMFEKRGKTSAIKIIGLKFVLNNN